MHLGAQLWIHATFLVFVAGAVYAQALTGFALALILLGLIGATNLVPLTDAVNASTIIAFCSAWTFLYRRRALRIERILVPTLVASAAGIAVGALLLTWLAGTAYQVLRLVLGASIVACALSLWRAAQPLPSLSSPAVYALTGGISGLLAGMFSLQLAAEALPVVLVVTSYAARRALPLSAKLFRGLVCALLIGTGLSMAIGAFLAMR